MTRIPLTVSTVSTMWRGGAFEGFRPDDLPFLDVQGLDVLAAYSTRLLVGRSQSPPAVLLHCVIW